MRKRITSLLLTLVMLLSLVPAMGVTASAADGFVEVSTYEQLENEVKKGEAKVKLVANIDTTGENGGAGVTGQTALKFFGNDNILDLNGHTLKLVSNTGTTFINVNKDLTIQDSGTGGRIDFVYGPSVMHRTTAIYVSHASNEDIAHLTVKSGTLSSTKGGITLIESIGNLTINGGKFYAPYEVGSGGTYAIHTIHQYNDNAKTIITGGEIDGVVFIQRTDSAATGTPNYGDIPVQIKGGTFKQHMQLRWTERGEPSGYPTEFSPAVEIAGGIFEKRINPIENGVWGRHLSTKLTGGTFKDYTSFGLGKGDSTGTDYKYYLKSLGNSIIMRGNEFRTSCDWSEADWFRVDVGSIYGGISLDGSESNPVTVIPNAWGMKSVTLDGTEINYAKDWKGAVEKMNNSTAHTLKFEWYPLAQKLKDAGYSYQTKCEHYISGSTAVQQTDTIAADKTSHTITIPAGVDPKVYSYDLQLNLQKDGSFVGIMSNEHIVKLVVSKAPVVTEISSAPVRLSAALTPGTSAPSATAVGSGYTVESINWYTDNSCTELASSFAAGTAYYGKIVLKPEKNYKFAADASALPFCDDPNENYSIVGSAAVAEDGSSLTLVVGGKTVSALKWESVDKTNQTYTIGNPALTLNAKAVGGDSSKPITYKLIAKKDGTETVKASASVAASVTDAFSAPLRFTEEGEYKCWFEATRGNVTITSDHFTVTVNAPGLSITNQSGDLTVKQNETARLFVKAVGHGVNYQWKVKNGGDWDALSSETAYDYSAPTTEVGEKIYCCVVTDKYGATESTNEMKVTVIAGTDPNLTPAIPLAAVNGDAPDPAVLWPSKSVPGNGWQGLEATYNVTAGDTFHGVATFSTIPTGEGYHLSGNPSTQDIYYRTYGGGVQKTPVLGTISYEWKAAETKPWNDTEGTIAVLSAGNSANITIPSDVDTYYAQLSVTNTIGEGSAAQAERSTVYITFHVHTHTYDAYAQFNETSHTKYCTACGDSITEGHTMESGVCKYCGYAPAKTYTVKVTNGTADPYVDVAPGTQVTLTANTAPSGQVFDKWVGNVAVASNNTFNMPSHNVTVAATYKPIAHTHSYSAWAKLDDNCHYQTCSVPGCDEPTKVEEHTFGNWTKVDNDTHKGTCTVCSYVKTVNHSWVFDHEDAPTFAAAGTRHYKCSCGATKTESIPALTAISAVNVTVTAPVKGAAPGIATTADTTYSVAATDWDPTVSSTFEGGTKYTVKVSLETTGNNRFTNATTFQINGKTATIVGTQPTATGAEDTKITLEFPATSSGSTGGGGGGGGVTTYAITVKSAKNGDVTASHKTASKGTTVTLTVDPDKGYVLDTLTVLDGKDKEIKLTEKNGKYTFTMPASKVTVEAMFKASAPTGKNPFIDVPAGSYYEDAVIWAVEKGITSGTSAVTFDPNGNCTRAQAVTFLWRAAGSPAPKTKVMPFTDVPSGSYYYDAVLWAMEQGITKGTSDTAFSPDATCTRAQAVTFLYRASGSPAVSGNSAFTDVAADAYYAAAVAWAEKNGVTGGIGNGLFGSGNNCTRAQIVTFLYRAMK